MTVQLAHLTIRYGDLTAVDDATAEFPVGAVGLLGRNGAGKSSILRALLGLVRPAAGEMRILDLSPDTSPTEVRAQVGYMPEKDCHVSGLNGFETVTLAGQLTGMPRADAARRAHEVLYLVGLDEQRYRPVSGYSAGMRQKVKLATALVHDPQILFLDEPTNGLDPRGRKDMLELIRHLATALGKSVVLSSHILADVENICSSIVLLERGRVLASGSLAELTAHSVRVFVLEVVGPDGLGEDLRGAGASEVETTGAGQYRVTLPDGIGPRVLFRAVLERGAVVHKLVEQRRSLEEVFLGAVHDAQGRGF